MTVERAAVSLRWTFDEIVEVGDSFDSAYELYDASFPEGERETREAIAGWLRVRAAESLAPDDYHMLVARGMDRAVEGIALFHYIAEVRCGFLGYLAVAPRQQGRGLGSALFAEVCAVIERDAGRAPWGVFSEIDPADPEDPDSLRRLAFWRRLGMHPLDLGWRYPRLHEGAAPLQMHLAFCALDGSSGALSGAEVRRAAIAIYRSVYHRPGDDSDLAAVLEFVGMREWVPYLAQP